MLYLGDLEKLFLSVKSLLGPGGVFVFSVEENQTNKKPYRLCDTGRYAHRKSYIEKLAKQVGFERPSWTESCKTVSLRRQQEKPVQGLLWVLEAPWLC